MNYICFAFKQKPVLGSKVKTLSSSSLLLSWTRKLDSQGFEADSNSRAQDPSQLLRL